MATATVAELDFEDRRASERELAIGDQVYLATDPLQALGTVVAIEGASYFVTWRRAGRTWVYPSVKLVLIVDL